MVAFRKRRGAWPTQTLPQTKHPPADQRRFFPDLFSSAERSQPSGNCNRALALNSVSPDIGALTTSLENSSTFTFARASALVISRTMPGRSCRRFRAQFAGPAPTEQPRFTGADDDVQAGALKILKRGEQGLAFFGGQFDAQNAGKLAAEPAHAAFQPVAAMIGHDARNGFHEAGAVRADDGHHQGNLHDVLLKFCRAAGKDSSKSKSDAVSLRIRGTKFVRKIAQLFHLRPFPVSIFVLKNRQRKAIYDA